MSHPRISSDSLMLLQDKIVEQGMEAIGADIIAQAMESVTLEVTEPESYTRTGNSRYGGVPDLPPEIAWPRTEDGLFLNFFMQVNLGEMPPVVGNPLPEKGMLYFFLASDEPATNITCQVLYYDGDLSALIRAEAPEEDAVAIDDYLEMEPHQLSGRLSLSLPGPGSAQYEQWFEHFSDDDQSAYEALQEAVGSTGNSRGGKLLGYTNDLIGSPRQNAVLVRSGNEDRIYDYQYHDEHQDEIVAGMEEWLRLLTLYSNRKVGITIWDAGFIQVLVHRDDLAKQDFSRVYGEVFSS